MSRRARVLVTVAITIAMPALALSVWVALPPPPALTSPPRLASLTLEDRNGLVLRSTRAADGSLQHWLSLGDIDPDILEAFVAGEDHRFYEHHGIDVRAVGRAITENLRAGRVRSGASTITMQLARLLVPGGNRTWHGKVVQALWALRLEAHLSKQEILEQYLNRVPLGQGTIGVDAAARLYFNASAARLSLGQAALLAGLASAPSSDNPFVAPDRARRRRALMLGRIGRYGYAPADGLDRAAREPVVMPRATPPFLAPHFTSRVLQWLDTTAAGTWRTSLDLPLQTALESEVRHTVTTLSDRGVREAALVVLDNRTGELLAWVGSPDFWADSAGQVDMVVSPRQPGSALKPFLYGLAFDRGYTAASVLPDIPRAYATSTGPYQPRNYDRRFHGPVRAREALASSYNVPAVDLADQIGAGNLLRVLHGAGFTSLTRSAEYYGLGLALGNGDVTLLELANGYRGLVAGGVWEAVQWRAVAPDQGSESRRFISAPSAALVLDIIADPVARIPGFGLETPFDFPFEAAVKTGTSHHFTDNWAVGVTGAFTVAVWVGNFDGQPMLGVSGVTGAGPLLHRAMLVTARRYAPGALPSPRAVGATRVRICALSGLRASAGCPDLDEWFLPGTAPVRACDWHQGGSVLWPAEYVEWAAQNGKAAVGEAAAGETAADKTAAGKTAAKGGGSQFKIVSPRPGDRYEIPPGMDARYATIALRAAATPGDGAVRWFVDGRQIHNSRYVLSPGTHVIRAIAASGATAETRIDVLAARPRLSYISR
ncbi:MAG TPA: penicillin-binding protein 1C [Gemmatimonadales bacterium]|jgi:penicillin-binding protein 1C|nr:penicillin-binding protein 1C [Gemmatimonadales bacterium]